MKNFSFNPFYRIKILRKIKKSSFEIAIQPTFSRTFISDYIVKVTNAPCRIGSAGDLSSISSLEKMISDKWYTTLIPAKKSLMMEIERNAEFLMGLGKINFIPNIAYIPKLDKIPEILESKNYFVIIPGAQWLGRCWPSYKFSEVINKISEDTGFLPVICGNKKEMELCRKVMDNSKVNCINLCGKTSLTQFVEIIRNAKFIIGNESSAIHIATAVGTPSICIMGGGHYGRFLPYPDYLKETGKKLPYIVVKQMDCFGCNWICKFRLAKNDTVPCISSIEIEDVIKVYKKMLEDNLKMKLLN